MLQDCDRLIVMLATSNVILVLMLAGAAATSWMLSKDVIRYQNELYQRELGHEEQQRRWDRCRNP
jgi:flagellar basal body-associated protein FliL